MQTMPPVFTVPVPVADRPQAVNQIKPPSEAGGSASNGGAGNTGARDPQLAEERAREIARLIGNRDISEDQVLIPGLLALDTREVGDQDYIDPNRPSVRGPEPLGDVPEALPPLPDEVAPDATVETTGNSEDEVALPGQSEPEVDLPEIGPQKGPEVASVPVKAQPASPGASAPDVPEPPEPGNVDIRR